MTVARVLAACCVFVFASSVGAAGEDGLEATEQSDGTDVIPKCPPICIPGYLYGEIIAKGLCSIEMFKNSCAVRPCVAYDGETQGFACKHVSPSPMPMPMPMTSPTPVLSQSLMPSLNPSPSRSVAGMELPPTPVSMTLQPSCSDLADAHTDEPGRTVEEEDDEEEGQEEEMEEQEFGGQSPEVQVTMEVLPMPDIPTSGAPIPPSMTATLSAQPTPPVAPSLTVSTEPNTSPTVPNASSPPPLSRPSFSASAPSRSPAPRDDIPCVVFTDPHIRTFDGLSYDCQASGEFTLLRETQGALDVQVRFAGPTPRGSVTKGVAARQLGSVVVQISISAAATAETAELAACPVALFVNGSAAAFDAEVSGSGFRVSRVAERVTLDLTQSAVRVEFRVASSDTFGCYLESLTTYIPRSLARSTSFVGLAGSPNNDFSDDWMSPIGALVPLPNNTDGRLFGTAYDYCAANWCVRNASDSLFTYEGSESHAMFDKCDEPYGAVIDPGSMADDDVRALCGNNTACLVDGTVGGIDDARRCLQAQAEAEEVTNNAAVLRFEPPVVVVGVAVNVLVTVDTTKMPAASVPQGLQRFDLFRVDPISGVVLGESIISVEDNGEAAFSDATAGDGIYTNLLAVQASYAGQVFGFRAVAVTSGMQAGADPLLSITVLSGVTSFSTQSGIGQRGPNSTTDDSADADGTERGNGGTVSFSNAAFAKYKLVLLYSWGADQEDLDSGTQFLTGKVGYDCFPNTPFLQFSRDDTGFRGSENVTVSLNEARTQQLWSNSTRVIASAGWYSPKSGSGPATLRVFMIDADSRAQIEGSGLAAVIDPGTQSDCAFTVVATVFIDVGADRTVVRLVRAP